MDNEIVKALEYCQYPDGRCCLSCKYSEEDTTHCETKLREDTINLINRQKAEAIKDFAERLKTSFQNFDVKISPHYRKTVSLDEYIKQSEWLIHSVTIHQIDNLVKEMTEGKDNA